MNQQHPEPLLTVHQVAERLSLSISTVYRLCQDRCLPYIRVFGRLRFERDAVEQFLKDRTITATYGDS